MQDSLVLDNSVHSAVSESNDHHTEVCLAPDIDSCYDPYVQSFIKIASNYSATGVLARSAIGSTVSSPLQYYKVLPCSQTISLKTASNVYREFRFNHVFSHDAPHPHIFRKVMIPLLKTVLKDFKDATLISYGARMTGKSQVMGTYSSFYMHENVLASTLGFIFDQMSRLRGILTTINVSCFEVCNNSVNDLVIDEAERILYSDKIKSVTVTTYKQAVDVLSPALHKRAKRARNSPGFYEPSQSHLFITLEIAQQPKQTLPATSLPPANRAVLTLIDLAGYSITPPDSTPSEELKCLGSDPNLWVNKSLSGLKQYMLNVDLHKYQNYSFASDGTSVLTQLLKQNFVNDSRIFILGSLHHSEDRTVTRAGLVDTLTFCNKFRNIVGRLLYLSSELAGSEASRSEESDVSMSYARPAGSNNRPGNVSFCTNASTERQLHMKPAILALNRALRLTLRKCLDCHNVSTVTSCYVINKTLEQLNLNLDEKMVDFNVLDVDIQKLHVELDQNLDSFLTMVDGKIESADDSKARGEIERLAQNISKLLFQGIAKMCYSSAQLPKSRRQSAVMIGKILHNNLCQADPVSNPGGINIKRNMVDMSARVPDDNSISSYVRERVPRPQKKGRQVEQLLLPKRKMAAAYRSKSGNNTMIGPAVTKTPDTPSRKSNVPAKDSPPPEQKPSGSTTKSDEKTTALIQPEGIQYIQDSMDFVTRTMNCIKESFSKEIRSNSCLACRRPTKKSHGQRFENALFISRPNRSRAAQFNAETEVSTGKKDCPEFFARNPGKESGRETARFGLLLSPQDKSRDKGKSAINSGVKQANISHILEDADRPILEFNDTKARLQNIAIIGANLGCGHSAKEKELVASSKGDETPKQIELEEDDEQTEKDVSISIDIDIDESMGPKSVNSAVHQRNDANETVRLEILSQAQLRRASETTEYVPAAKSVDKSILTFSMQDSPVPKIPDSAEKRGADFAQRPRESSGMKSVARKLFEERYHPHHP